MSYQSRLDIESSTYLPHVDGLRALAVALVVIFHAWPSALAGGFVGVDVFFVISGFIITRQIFSEMETGSFSFVSFLGRRARRLIPAAFVCCLLVTAVAALVLMPDALARYSESLAAVWTMTANFYFFSSSGYFDTPSAEAPLLHMWSLAVEDQFYLTWPLLLLLLSRRLMTRPRIIAAVLGLAALSLLHSAHSAATNPTLAFYLPFSRAFELLAGCALALGYPLVKSIAPRTRIALDTIGLLLVVLSPAFLHSGVPFPGFAVVPTIIGSVLLIGAGLYGPTPISRLLSARPVVMTGRMSYSIYLYHWPAIAFSTYWLGRAPHAGEAAVIVLTGLALAALSWLLVEQKATQALRLYHLPATTLLKRTAVAGTFFCLLAMIGGFTHGLPQRLDEPAYEVYSSASEGNPLRATCDGYDRAFRHNTYCSFGPAPKKGASYDVAIFGDSNADHFVPMIAALTEKAGLSGRQVTQSSCAPLIGAAYDRAQYIEEDCARYQETILQFLDRNPNLKLAVLSWAWVNYGGIAHANRVSAASGSQEARSFSEFAAATIAIFRKRGIEVLIVGQVPHLDSFSLRCLADAARRDTEETDCTMSRQAVDRQLDAYQAVVQKIDDDDTGVWFLDMRKLLCTDLLCSAFKDDVLLYRDNKHLNGKGAAYLARYAALPPLGPH